MHPCYCPACGGWIQYGLYGGKAPHSLGYVGPHSLGEGTIVVHTAENWLKFILRFNGILAVMAIVAVLMPQSWLVWCVSKVEPGLNVGLLRTSQST